jgi:putative Mn2+ efflux pump MntP
MIVGAVAAVTFFAGGGKTIVSNLSYLAAVSLYLGFVVIALVGAMFSFDGKEEKRHAPVQARIFHPRRTDL